MGWLPKAEAGQGPLPRGRAGAKSTPQTYQSSYLALPGIYTGHTLFLECYKSQH